MGRHCNFFVLEMRSSTFVITVMAVAAIILTTTVEGRIDFAQWKDCESCVGAGYGWCTIRRICGGFANKQCGEGAAYKNYPPGESPYDKKSSPPPSGPAGEDGDVMVLTDGSYEREMKKKGSKRAGIFVEFYAPWCGHCKNLAPTWGTLGTTFKGSSAVIAKAEATIHKAAAAAFGVTGFPSLFWVPAGQVSGEKYQGSRDGDALTSFVNSKAGLSRVFGQAGKEIDTSQGVLSSAARYIRKFVAATGPFEQEKAIESLKNKVKGETSSFYATVLDRVKTKGEAWVSKQIKRVSSLLESQDVSETKKDELQVKHNILSDIASHLPSLAGDDDNDSELDIQAMTRSPTSKPLSLPSRPFFH